MSVVLDKVVDLSYTPTIPNLVEQRQRSHQLLQRSAKMYEVEKFAQSALREEAMRLRRATDKAYGAKRLRLPMLNPIVFSWRIEKEFDGDKIRVPTLAIYSIANPSCSITCEAHMGWFTSSGAPRVHFVTHDYYPRVLRANYADVLESLEALVHERVRTLRLVSTFGGVIPDATKEKIKEAKESKQFKEIYLIAESNWQLEQTAPFVSDPLVVGEAYGELWLIDRFDPTPVEEYIATEFTT